MVYREKRILMDENDSEYNALFKKTSKSKFINFFNNFILLENSFNKTASISRQPYFL